MSGACEMSEKARNSSFSAGKNTAKWMQNLSHSSKRRPMIPQITEKMDSLLWKLPLNRTVVGRFLGLYSEVTSRENRIIRMSTELLNLWEKLSLPSMTRRTIERKVGRLISDFDAYKKRTNERFEMDLINVFDITNLDGVWLCREDKQFYQRQIETGGKSGYSTVKLAPKSTVHCSKYRKQSPEPSTSYQYNFSSSSDTEEESQDSTFKLSGDTELSSTSTKTHSRTRVGVSLVNSLSLSTNKASKVLQHLQKDQPNADGPSQSGIWRAMIKNAETIKEKLKELIQEEHFCLHFDGKRLNNKEYQVVCLSNPTRTVNLSVIICKSGSADDIFLPMVTLLNEFEAWSSIKMIISDTTAVNTGKNNGVVKRLKNEFRKRGFLEPQFIGCQHHILDLILRHMMDFQFQTKTVSPNMNYGFIEQILNHYEELKELYMGQEVLDFSENLGWRDDFKFLFELCEAYKHHETHGNWPYINWRTLPSIHNARWNSRAIYALIGFFLFENKREELKSICDFIANTWAKIWFRKQFYEVGTYEELHDTLIQWGCAKALRSFVQHWVKEDSILKVPRTNILAERAVKLMEEIVSSCKSDKYVNHKFMNSNFNKL